MGFTEWAEQHGAKPHTGRGTTSQYWFEQRPDLTAEVKGLREGGYTWETIHAYCVDAHGYPWKDAKSVTRAFRGL